MSVCGGVEKGRNQIFQGALWLRTECPAEIGHMLDDDLDRFVTVCSNVRIHPNSAEHPVRVSSSSLCFSFPSNPKTMEPTAEMHHCPDERGFS